MKYACIGEHLKHSFSKEIHAALADYEYGIMEIPKDELDSFMKKADFSGINVTIPYKEAVIPYLSSLDKTALEIGSVNTVVKRSGALYGYNTDFYGMSKLFSKAGIDPCCKKAAVLGTGGTSKTARAVLKSLGASEIITVSRSKTDGVFTYDELYEKHSDIEILVNTTPLGMFPENEGCAADISKFKRLSGVIDAVYNPLRSRLILSAAEKGIPCEGGLYMLVAQAVFASEIFLDRKYPDGTLDSVFEKILKSKETIVLTGMPGSGKSTVGRLLAKELGRVFFDTDAVIEEKAGITIKEIFERHGEAYFRDLESAVIEELSKKSSAVISSGGGAVLRDENIRRFKSNGRIVFIDRDVNELVPTESRPLASDIAAIKARYLERYPRYLSTMDASVKVDGPPTAVVNKIKTELSL